MISIDTVFDLFERHGDQRYGEEVSQLGHALQCAQLAREDGADDPLVVAALLHDVGQFIDGAGETIVRHGRDGRHEITGAALLRTVFLDDVTEPIRLHVEAKRFLCAVEPGYIETLSPASMLSLRYQGGPMTAPQQVAFAHEPHWRASIRLRRYDDAGKKPENAPAPLDAYQNLLEALLQSVETSAS